MTERFYVREHSGYRFHPDGQNGGNSREITEVMVLDRDYCHRVVWSSETALEPKPTQRTKTRTLARQPLAYRRDVAARLCRELNAEDEAQVAA